MIKEKYTKAVILQQCMDVIEKYTPVNISEMLFYAPFCRCTFYNKIKVNSKEYMQIIEALQYKKTKFAYEIKQKLMNSNDVEALIALIKMYGTEEDRQALKDTYEIKLTTRYVYDSGEKANYKNTGNEIDKEIKGN